MPGNAKPGVRRQVPTDASDGSGDLAEQELQSRILAEKLDEISGLSLAEVLQAGHEDLLRLLVAKVRTGQASHQEMAILRNILRDNGMVMGFDPMKTIPGEALPLPTDLPRLEAPDYGDD